MVNSLPCTIYLLPLKQRAPRVGEEGLVSMHSPRPNHQRPQHRTVRNRLDFGQGLWDDRLPNSVESVDLHQHDTSGFGEGEHYHILHPAASVNGLSWGVSTSQSASHVPEGSLGTYQPLYTTT
ncbi:hypothetical protein Ac2012v2_006238 [Leucoagaricus gongylophorus]